MGHGLVVDGIAKCQTLQGTKFLVKSLVLLSRRSIPQKFRPLKFQNSGHDIWRIHPPPFHAPPFACLRDKTEEGQTQKLSSENAVAQVFASSKKGSFTQFHRGPGVFKASGIQNFLFAPQTYKSLAESEASQTDAPISVRRAISVSPVQPQKL